MASIREIPYKRLSWFIGKLADAGMTIEQANEVLENPALAARMVAVLTLTTVIWKVKVDYSKSLKEMITAGQFREICRGPIDAEKLISKEKGTAEVEFRYAHLDRDLPANKILKEMKKQSLRPATLPELLAFGAINPEEQEKYPIYALGSILHSDYASPRLSKGREVSLTGHSWAHDKLCKWEKFLAAVIPRSR